jgi:hypothetical protein
MDKDRQEVGFQHLADQLQRDRQLLGKAFSNVHQGGNPGNDVKLSLAVFEQPLGRVPLMPARMVLFGKPGGTLS